ncbi:MAG: GNAT family N-acetyltransferase, partial [Planctomycetes bacterium]|nr:GNAT family N-acetyltransferase [Planctomycetota bacterium]
NETDVVMAIETLADEHVGISGLHQISYRHGATITGTLIGRRQLWGHGYGSDAIRIRTRYAFEVLGLRLLLSEIMADNARSLAALVKSGYREVGRIPQRWWKRGGFHDAILLAVNRADWQSSQSEK